MTTRTRTSNIQSAPPTPYASHTMKRIVFVTPHPLARQHARTWGLLTALAQSGRYPLTVLALCRTTAEIAATIQFRRFGVETFALPDDTPSSADGAAYDTAPHLRATLERIIARGDVAIVHIEGERLAPLARDLAVPVVWDIAESATIIQRLTAQSLRAIGDPYEIEVMRACASVIVADKSAAVALLAARHRASRSHLTALPPVSPATPAYQLDAQPPASPSAIRSVMRSHMGVASFSLVRHPVEKRQHDPHVCIIPNGVDVLDIGDEPISALSSHRMAQAGAQARRRQGSVGVLIAGDFGADLWVKGIVWFLREIAPRLWRLRPELSITLLARPGNAISPAMRALLVEARHFSGRRIRLVEDTTEIRPYARQAALAVVPLAPDARPTGDELCQTHTCALTTMALGLPTVLTQPALAGLLAAPGRDLLVATSADRLLALITRVLGDRELWGLLAHNGRAYVERRHSWRQSAAQLEALYESILAQVDRSAISSNQGGVSSDRQDGTASEDADEVLWDSPNTTRPMQVSVILAELHAQDAASEASQSQWNFVGAFRNFGNPDAAVAQPTDQRFCPEHTTIRSAPVSTRRLSRWR